MEPKLPPGAAPGGGVSLTAAEGDENLSKAALKNKKKREAKKAKDAEAKTAGLTAPTENGGGAAQASPSRSPERRSRPHSPSRPKSGYETPRRREGSRQRGPPLNTTIPPPNGQPAPAAAPAPAAPELVAAAAAPELTVTTPGAGSPHEKKIRSLLKKLRAIDDLKMRQAGGEKLEGTQVLKIGTEAGVRKELADVGYRDE